MVALVAFRFDGCLFRCEPMGAVGLTLYPLSQAGVNSSPFEKRLADSPSLLLLLVGLWTTSATEKDKHVCPFEIGI